MVGIDFRDTVELIPVQFPLVDLPSALLEEFCGCLLQHDDGVVDDDLLRVCASIVKEPSPRGGVGGSCWLGEVVSKDNIQTASSQAGCHTLGPGIVVLGVFVHGEHQVG